MMHKSKPETIGVHLGYAADAAGEGIVYARLRSNAGERLVRAVFRVKRFAGLGEREVGYAALAAVAQLLIERRYERVEFALADTGLVDDLEHHRDVPPPLVLPYVRLRCSLNRFAKAGISMNAGHEDLAQRARSEVALRTAA